MSASIENAIYALLSTNTGFMAVAGTRIYQTILPQAVVYPCVSFQAVTGASDYVMEGASGLASVRMQFDLFADDPDDLLDLKAAVMNALSAYRGSVGSPPTKIQGAFRESERDNYESPLSEAGLRVWSKSLDFNIWFEEDYS